MRCAPVIIITLNRYKHLRRCIESLKQNGLAKETDLYVGLDYPPGPQYEEGYRKVQDYLNCGIDGFHEVIIVKQSANKGMFQNFVSVQKEVYKKNDRFIYTEDDNEFAVNYLEYMNRCLEKYENNDSVLAICGYACPIENKSFKGNVYHCETYFSALGYGMWKVKEDRMRKYLNRTFFNKIYYDSKYMKKLSKMSKNQYVNMIKGMLEYTSDLIYKDQIREVDLAFGLYMIADKKRVIYPVISKVRNWGYDGTGVNCGKAQIKQCDSRTHRGFQFEQQTLDQEEYFADIIEERELTQKQINKLFDNYFCISGIEYLKAKAAYILSNVIGIRNVKKVIGKARK